MTTEAFTFTQKLRRLDNEGLARKLVQLLTVAVSISNARQIVTAFGPL